MASKTKSSRKKKPVAKARTAKPSVKRAKAPVARKPAAMAAKGKALPKKLAKSKAAARPVVEAPAKALKPVFNAKQFSEYKDLLQKVRDRVVDEIAFLAGDNLNRSQRESSGDLSSYSFHMADQGTDNFDREFALNLVSSEQDVLYEIDEAINRIELKTYGRCEVCDCAIERARLKALPFAKMCIKCKSAAEKGKSRYRPFGPTISQSSSAE
jgi:RNA polymerase-binding transcription factor DksA